MLSVMPLALLALAAVQQTDTTINVTAGTRLQVNNFAGTVTVATWDRNAVRVQADHGSRDQVTVDLRGSVLEVESESDRGTPSLVDYTITIPRAMAVDIEGVELDITVDGVGGDLQLQSVEGGITVRGAGGAVSASTVEGDLEIQGGRGTLKVSGVEGVVRITGARGDLTIETVEGDVTLDDVDGANVDVGTVEGIITYRGVIRDGGRYRLSSHEGDIILGVPAATNASVSVATFDGSFEADPAFQVQVASVRAGRRFSFTLGTGSARIELESFDGAIRLEKR